MVFQRKKIASALACALVAAPAIAQDVRVEVTGSSIRRVETEGALPVTVVTQADIAKTGVTSTEQLLQMLPVIETLGGLQLSSGSGLSTYGTSNVSLRGLGANRTLVLVNGRRLIEYAGFGTGDAVNVNSIPISAIERVEVLRDGASAVYGSDAVAGVINFILRKDTSGFEVGGQWGTPTRSGGGQSANMYAVWGFGDLAKDRFNVSASFSYTKEDSLPGKDRDFANVGTIVPYFVSGATGQGNIEGAFTPGTGSAANGTWVEGSPQPGFGTSPGRGYGNPLAAQNNCEAVNMRLDPNRTSKGAPFCNYDTAPFVDLLPSSERINVSGNLTWQITDNLQAFGEALYANQKVVNTIQGSPVRRSFLQTDSLFPELGIDPALLIYPSNPNYQIAANYLNAQGFGSIVGQPLAITSRVQDFGGRQTSDEADQWRFLAGLKGNAWNQDWEVAYYHNRSELDGSVTGGYFSQTKYAKLVQTSNCWNPWSLAQCAEFANGLPAAEYRGPTLAATAKSDTFDGKITGEVWQAPAGPVLYAAGASWVKQSIEWRPDDNLFTGDIAGLGGAVVPLSEDRTIWAVYGEVNFPVLKGLEGTLAGRYDHYSDFGGTFNWFANVRWQPTKWLLTRGAYGTGFRAPSLGDLWYPITLGSSAQFNDPVTGAQDLQVNEFTGGNPNLEPEKSKQWSIGVVLQPTSQLSFTVDWFSIKLKDIIATPSTQEVVSGEATGNPAYAGKVVRDANGDIQTVESLTVNTGSAKVQGVDIGANWRQSYSWGTPSISFLGTYMDKFDQTSPGGLESQKVGTIIDDDCNPVLDADTGGVVPEWKHSLTFGYDYGPWSTTLMQTYYKGYRDGCDLNGDYHKVPSKGIWDFQLAWTGIKNLRLAVGLKNIFDSDPPLYIPVSNQFQSGYDVTMYDPRARFLYGSASYKF